MTFWNTLRKIERIRFYVGLLAVGILFVVLSGIVLSQPKTERISVEGTIVRIESRTDGAGEEQWDVYVSYTDADGNVHESVPYPSYSSSMKEGKTVTVLYDPAAPEEIQAPGLGLLPFVFLGIGLVAVGVSVTSIASGLKKKESNSPFEDSEKQFDPFLAEQIRNDDTQQSEYYFHWTGKLNQSYILETPARQPVFEAICDHIGVFTPYRYTFVDHVNGRTQAHKVSHTVTGRYGDGAGGTSFSVVSSSGFKIDDVDNWDYLAGLGYSVVPKRSGIKLNFDVLHCGVPVAELEAAGVNILRDDKKSALGDKLPGNGLYRVRCKASDLEGVFTACFSVSRVEFF